MKTLAITAVLAYNIKSAFYAENILYKECEKNDRGNEDPRDRRGFREQKLHSQFY